MDGCGWLLAVKRKARGSVRNLATLSNVIDGRRFDIRFDVSRQRPCGTRGGDPGANRGTRDASVRTQHTTDRFMLYPIFLRVFPSKLDAEPDPRSAGGRGRVLSGTRAHGDRKYNEEQTRLGDLAIARRKQLRLRPRALRTARPIAQLPHSRQREAVGKLRTARPIAQLPHSFPL